MTKPEWMERPRWYRDCSAEELEEHREFYSDEQWHARCWKDHCLDVLCSLDEGLTREESLGQWAARMRPRAMALRWGQYLPLAEPFAVPRDREWLYHISRLPEEADRLGVPLEVAVWIIYQEITGYDEGGCGFGYAGGWDTTIAETHRRHCESLGITITS